MQKQKFNPEAHSISLSFGQHIVHGYPQDSAFGDVMHNMLLREINKASDQMFAELTSTPTAQFESEDVDFDSVRALVNRWSKVIADETFETKFRPCSIPDWMRPTLHNKGMTDAEIDSILIIGIEPSIGLGPGLVLKTVTI